MTTLAGEVALTIGHELPLEFCPGFDLVILAEPVGFAVDLGQSVGRVVEEELQHLDELLSFLLGLGNKFQLIEHSLIIPRTRSNLTL